MREEIVEVIVDALNDVALQHARETIKKLKDHSGSGWCIRDTVGEKVVAGEVLYLAATGKYLKANASAYGTMPVTVLAMEDINAYNAGKLLLQGCYRDDSWAWKEPPKETRVLYAHTTSGKLVQFANRPVRSGAQIQFCGTVVTTNGIGFHPQLDMVGLEV